MLIPIAQYSLYINCLGPFSLLRLSKAIGSAIIGNARLVQWAFAGINRARSIQLKLRQRIELFFSSLRDDDAATSSNIARRPVKFRYSRYLFHDPPALSAFTLIFSVGRAVRTPVLARHRRVKGATLTRLTGSRAKHPRLRCDFLSQVGVWNALVPLTLPRRSRGQGRAWLARVRTDEL